MDQVTKVRRHIKREEWKSIISECRASGMTVKAWCKAKGLNVYAYLQQLLLYMPSTEWQQYSEEPDELMPWSLEVQEQCKQ